MCFIYDDTAEAHQETIRVAKKVHRCAGCTNSILIGEFYKFASGIFDCSPFSLKTCGACELTKHRIYLKEREHGCRHIESFIATEDLLDYCNDSGFEWSNREDGQTHLKERHGQQRIQRSEYRTKKKQLQTA